MACRNWSNFAVTFEPPWQDHSRQVDCMVDGISLSGGQTIETAVSFNGSENDGMNVNITGEAPGTKDHSQPPRRNKEQPGDIRVDTGKTWISDALRNWHTFGPTTAACPS